MFWKLNKLEKLQERLLTQKYTIDAYLDQLSKQDRNRLEWCTVHDRECMSTGLLMWEKDLEHRYTFANARLCNDFFHTSLANVSRIIGRTTSEVIEDFKGRTGFSNTFGNICVTSDDYVLKQKKPCRFWEIGYINDKIFILDATIKPVKRNEKIIGTAGWALNQSSKECEIKSLLEMFLKNGEAERLNPYSEDVAVYHITKKLNPFNKVFPK
jgi:hypothetical protein